MRCDVERNQKWAALAKANGFYGVSNKLVLKKKKPCPKIKQFVCPECHFKCKRIAIASLCETCYLRNMRMSVGRWRMNDADSIDSISFGISGPLPSFDFWEQSKDRLPITREEYMKPGGIWEANCQRAMEAHHYECLCCAAPAEKVHVARSDAKTMLDGGFLLWPLCERCYTESAEGVQAHKTQQVLNANTRLLYRRAHGKPHPSLVKKWRAEKKLEKAAQKSVAKPRVSFHPPKFVAAPTTAPLHRRPAAVERAMGIRPSWLEPPQ